MPDQAFEPAVVNTGPILALSLLGVLDLLKKFYQPVYIASAVEQEIQYGGHGAPGYKEVKESACSSANTLIMFLALGS